MPTKYTKTIGSGIEFPEFVMGCAEVFGAFISMRDLPTNAPESVEKELLKLQSMTIDEVEKAYELEYQDEIHDSIKYNNGKIELKHKYESMLEKVRDWIPPSAEHENLKEFMIEQIEDSIKVDCSYFPAPIVQISTASLWLEDRIKSKEKDLEYYQKEWAEEQERCAERTEWVSLLRKSLEVDK